MNISCNTIGFFLSSLLTPDGDPEDDECLGLWLSLLLFPFFVKHRRVDEVGGG